MIELDPQNAYARCWLAIVHFFRGENDKFEAESQLALSLNPNDPETLNDRALLHERRGDAAAARADFDGAIRSDPGSAAAFRNRAAADVRKLHGAAVLG